MLIFWRLMFGHLLADFTFQTNFINKWKRSSIWGMLAHCATHPVCYVALTWPYLNDVWVSLGPVELKGWLCVLIVFVGHFIEDEWRVFTIFKFKTPDNTLYLAWDQIIHYAIIFLVIPEGWQNDPSLMPEAWPVLGCLFVLATHAATIIIYFIEKDLAGASFPSDQEKYITMLERLILGLLFLIPGAAYPVLAAGWFGVMYVVRAKRYLDLSWYALYLGGGIAAACGLVARFVYYS